MSCLFCCVCVACAGASPAQRAWPWAVLPGSSEVFAGVSRAGSGSRLQHSTFPRFCAGAAEYLLSVWNIFMPEKIGNLLALKTFYLCLYQLGEVEV